MIGSNFHNIPCFPKLLGIDSYLYLDKQNIVFKSRLVLVI